MGKLRRVDWRGWLTLAWAFSGALLLQHGDQEARRAGEGVVRAAAGECLEAGWPAARGDVSNGSVGYGDRTRRRGVSSGLGGFVIESSSMIFASSVQAR